MDNRDRSRKRQRHEAKYLITEAQAAEIRRYCMAHLPLDPHSAHEPGYKYPVLSIYLDSPARELLRSAIDRRVDRYKLRVRTYRRHNAPLDGLPAFSEIKRKSHGIVRKTRARVEPGLAEELLWKEHFGFGGRGEYDVHMRMSVDEFVRLRNRISAGPVIGVSYLREAYEGSSAERIRVTLDRNLHYGLLASPGSGLGETWWPAGTGGVILEVKFTNTYPFWVTDMLRRAEVLRRGVCKYVICTQAAGTFQRRTFG